MGIKREKQKVRQVIETETIEPDSDRMVRFIKIRKFYKKFKGRKQGTTGMDK